jgi:hypothetical protein
VRFMSKGNILHRGKRVCLSAALRAEPVDNGRPSREDNRVPQKIFPEFGAAVIGGDDYTARRLVSSDRWPIRLQPPWKSRSLKTALKAR